MERIDAVLVGAEDVMETSGFIKKISTLNIGRTSPGSSSTVSPRGKPKAKKRKSAARKLSVDQEIAAENCIQVGMTARPPYIETPRTLRDYYRWLYPIKMLCRWLSYGQAPEMLFSRREFAFVLDRDGEEVHLRYRSFTNAYEFEKELFKVAPTKLDIGSIYSHAPKDRLRYGINFMPVEREFVFDIDLDAYDNVRFCCRDATVCRLCWKFIVVAIVILERTLKEDVGYKSLLWTFSGRRGVHCWVGDERARALGNNGRSSFCEYISLFEGAKLVLRPPIRAGPSSAPRPLHPMIEASYRRAVDALGGKLLAEMIDEQGRRRLQVPSMDLFRPERRALLGGRRTCPRPRQQRAQLLLRGAKLALRPPIRAGPSKASAPRPLHPMIEASYRRAVDALGGKLLAEMIDEQGWLDDESSALKDCTDEELRSRLSRMFREVKVSQRWEVLQLLCDERAWMKGREKGYDVDDQPPAEAARYFIRHFVLSRVYPRLDTNVSTGMNHLLKSPFCIHPKRGCVAVPLDTSKVHEFDVLSAPRVDLLLEEVRALREKEKTTEEGGGEGKDKENVGTTRKALDYKRTALGPHIAVFEKFVASVTGSK